MQCTSTQRQRKSYIIQNCRQNQTEIFFIYTFALSSVVYTNRKFGIKAFITLFNLSFINIDKHTVFYNVV